MKNNIKKIICYLGLAVMAVACDNNKIYSNKQEEKTSAMEQVEQQEIQEYKLANSDITIGFDKENVFGFAGVNRYFGTYEKDGDKISITNLGTTMMLGEEVDMKKESEYLELLSKVNTIIMEDDKIILSNGSDIELIFSR